MTISEKKTELVNLKRTKINFLGFGLVLEKPRKEPGRKRAYFVGKAYPRRDRMDQKVKELCQEIRGLIYCSTTNDMAAKIHLINQKIIGITSYYKVSICSDAFRRMDYQLNRSAYYTWKKLRCPKTEKGKILLAELCNLKHRHSNSTEKTFGIRVEGLWYGITKASLTRSTYEQKPFYQEMTPYTKCGRQAYKYYQEKYETALKDIQSINSETQIRLSSRSRTKYNFLYYINREQAYIRDKNTCQRCNVNLISSNVQAHCHHINSRRALGNINDKQNLIWLCENCHKREHKKTKRKNII
ncbi:HNH endonuclease [Enterococcus termitis]|nr:HNH endonuclease signature motif containing protein [Enterococcus termitis]